MTNSLDMRDERATLAQVVGVIAPPLAFGANLLINYSLVQHSCSTGHHYVLHLTSMVCLLIALLSGYLGWRQYQHAHQANDEGGTALDRSHFLGLLGTISSLFFALVIIANAVPQFALTPCD